MLKFSLAALLLGVASLAQANDIKYSYVEGGLYFHSDEESETTSSYSYDDELTAALFQVNGSVAFGPLFYLPMAIEIQSVVVDYDYCYQDYYDYTICDSGESSSVSTRAQIGAGLHFDIGSSASIYTEVGLMSERTAVDYDYDSDDYDFDEDETESDNGNQVVVGLRFQPAPLVEFNVGISRQDWSDLDDVFFRKNLSVQFNVTEHIGIAVRTIVYGEDAGDFDTKFWGASFRYSFK
jgi:hypothetical protein